MLAITPNAEWDITVPMVALLQYPVLVVRTMKIQGRAVLLYASPVLSGTIVPRVVPPTTNVLRDIIEVKIAKLVLYALQAIIVLRISLYPSIAKPQRIVLQDHTSPQLAK